MSSPILFYSNKCKHSKKVIDIITQNNITINKICIDDNNAKLPSFLKVVPTIVDKSLSKPLEGNNVFEWLNQFNKTQTKSEVPNESIQPFFSNEMSGYSDNYSYIGNENPMEHSFQFLGNNSINTSNPSASNDDSSEKEKELNSDFERLMEQRKSDANIPNQLQRQ